MKLIKTVALVFRQGNSDKVYEVDLGEVGPDRFVVNFRYGRRGAKLQSGSKTAVPVARDKAEAALRRPRPGEGREGLSPARRRGPAATPTAAAAGGGPGRRGGDARGGDPGDGSGATPNSGPSGSSRA